MPAVVLAAALAALYLVIDPPSADLAAHVYRVELFERAGLVAWDNGWYGGHHMPGYSLLFAPLAAWLGIGTLAAASIVAATAAFAATMRRLGAADATAAAAWFAVAMTAMVVSGRLPFALGVAVAAAAFFFAAGRRSAPAALLGAATTLASPVAGLFAVLIGVAWWWGGGRPRAPLAAAGAAAGAGVLLLGAFPQGGTEPFVASAFWPAAVAVAIALAVVPAGPLRSGAALYLALLVAAFALPTPVGGNATRLAALLGGPLAVLLLRRRPALLALAAVPLAYWTLYPAVRDWSTAAGDPARHAAYYAPLLSELRRRSAGRPPGRLEIPFTRSHWEAAHAAGAVDGVLLARGWQRQLDRERNPLFYDDAPLTARRYRRWLRDNAVRWVALPDAALDDAGQKEARLIGHGLPFLAEAWRGRHWRLFAVREPGELGASAVDTDGFTTRGGLVRIRWSPYWAVVSGRGCVARGPGGWTRVEPGRRGAAVRVGIRFAPLRALSGGRRCR